MLDELMATRETVTTAQADKLKVHLTYTNDHVSCNNNTTVTEEGKEVLNKQTSRCYQFCIYLK